MRRAWLLLAALAACTRAPARPTGVAADAGAAVSPPPAAVLAPPPPLPDDLDPAPDPVPASAETVTIKLTADARRQARVTWGRKDLGIAPLEIVRPRGSAPLDLLIVAPGHLPLHTRVFTDRNDTLALRLYTEREAAVLPGFSSNRDKAPSPTTKPRQ
jgi:hypothetical protein